MKGALFIPGCLVRLALGLERVMLGRYPKHRSECTSNNEPWSGALCREDVALTMTSIDDVDFQCDNVCIVTIRGEIGWINDVWLVAT